MALTNSKAGGLSPTRGLSSDNIKIIALLAMTIFHAADILFPWWKRCLPDVWAALILLLCMGIGMTAMPIICFLAAESAYHTKNWKKYLLKILLWAVPSHIAYALATGKPINPFSAPFIMHTSVLWTICCGLGAFFAQKQHGKIITAAALLLLALGLYGDWGICAGIAIYCMALTRNNFNRQMLAMALCFGIGLVYTYVRQGPALALIQACFLFSIPVLKRYNGKLFNTRPLPRFAFYWYYPVHLFILAGLRLLGVGSGE